jgi:hypothetical protein
MARPITAYRGLWSGPARATNEHLQAANDDAGDLTAEDLSAIDDEFGIDRRNLERAGIDRRERGAQ